MQITPFALTLFVVVSGAVHAAEPEPHTIAGFSSPESVLVDGGRRFVSNIGTKPDPTAPDGDGFIAELDESGAIINARAFPPAGETLNASKGMAILDGRLYVTDIDRVEGFDLASGAKVFTAILPAEGPVMANDLLAVGTDLVVSDTLGNIVWRLDPASGAFAAIPGEVPGANGLAEGPDGRLYVVGVGKQFAGGTVFASDAEGGFRPLAADPRGIFDGIAVLADGTLIVSDWVGFDGPVAGRLRHLGPDGSDLGDIAPDAAIVSPADLALDSASGTLWVPSMLTGSVVVLPLQTGAE